MKNRPTHNGSIVTTPRTGKMVELLGPGAVSGSICFSSGETRHLDRIYEFHPEEGLFKKPTELVLVDIPEGADSFQVHQIERENARRTKAWENQKSVEKFMQAGADRNMLRYAEADGLRLIGWLARYCSPGEDPLKVLINIAVQAGLDVDYEDAEWADCAPEEDL